MYLTLFLETAAEEKGVEVAPQEVQDASKDKTLTNVVISADVNATVEYRDGKENLTVNKDGVFDNKLEVRVNLSEEAAVELTVNIADGYSRKEYVVKLTK